MADQVQLPIQITQPQLNALAERLVTSWQLDELPNDIKYGISKAVAVKLAESSEWEQLSAAIVEKFQARRDEIAQRIVSGMIESLSRGIVDATRKCTEDLAKRMAGIRF